MKCSQITFEIAPKVPGWCGLTHESRVTIGFPIRAHAQVSCSIPGGWHTGGSHLMFLALYSPFLSFLKKKIIFQSKKEIALKVKYACYMYISVFCVL